MNSLFKRQVRFRLHMLSLRNHMGEYVGNITPVLRRLHWLPVRQRITYKIHTTSYIQSTEWHGAKVYSKSSSALHSDEATTIFFKKLACKTEVEPQILRR